MAAAQVAGDRPVGSPGRFLMQPADDGILRLDSQTGALTFCRKGNDGWACTMVPDERRALDEENAKLKQQVRELSDAVLRLEELLGVDEGKSKKGQLPTEREIGEAADYIRGIVKVLREKARDMEKDLNEPLPPAPKRG